MKWVKWAQPFWLILVLVLFWRNDPLYVARFSVLAAVLHEGGHILVYYLLVGKLPLLRISPLGIAMEVREADFTGRELLLLAAAGPLSNFLFAGAALLIMQWRAFYSGYCFAVVNLVLGLFNLLPIEPLDGWRLFRG